MTKPQDKMEVTEPQAKCFRVWEELGGPSYLKYEDAVAIFHQMTNTEQGEVPAWRKQEDPGFLMYQLPKRFQRKITTSPH